MQALINRMMIAGLGIITVLAVVWLLTIIVTPALNAHSAAATCKYASLHDLYLGFFDNADHDAAIHDLSVLIYNSRLRYSEENLVDTIIPILKDYFSVSEDMATFQGLLYHLIEDKYITVIQYGFNNTVLSSPTHEAIRQWQTPSRIVVRPQQAEVPLDSALYLDIAVYNELSKKIHSTNLTYTIEPADIGVFEPRRARFTPEKPGTGKLIVGLNGDSDRLSAGVTITVPAPANNGPVIYEFLPTRILAGNKVHIVGQNLLDKNSQSMVSLNGRPLITDFLSDHKMVVSIPQGITSGRLIVSTGSGCDTSAMDLKIIALPDPPSVRTPVVVSGMTAMTGLGYFVFDNSASSRYDTYYNTPGRPQALYDSYTQANDWRQVTGILTLGGIVASGYLWYTYIKAHNNYQQQREKALSQFGIIGDGDRLMLTFAYRF